MLPIYDITPFTMLDFPDRTACIIWMAGCNMRCLYCHNPDIVRGGKGQKTEEDMIRFLHGRRGLLDGVVLSGGEATLYRDLPNLARRIRAMGFDIKLDTNGTRPAMVESLLHDGLLDYVALDLKASPETCASVTGRKIMHDTLQTLSLLTAQTDVPFEVRTTVHHDLLDARDIGWIIETLEEMDYRGTYYLQPFRAYEGQTLGHLREDAQRLDINALPPAHGFDIEWRAG